MTVQRQRSGPDEAECAPEYELGEFVHSATDECLTESAPRRGLPPAASLLLVVAVALAATNLRPAVSSLASVLGILGEDLGVSTLWLSVVTALPVVCFGAASFLAPRVVRAFGASSGIALALTVVGAGLLLRVVDGPLLVLLGTLVACSGIAVCNVLIPAVVKRWFPRRMGVVTGVYGATLALGASVPAALTPVLAQQAGDWRPALAVWAGLALLALLAWTAATRFAGVHGKRGTRIEAAGPGGLYGNRLAWVITGFFGIQSTLAYVVSGWIPLVLQGAGVSPGQAGLMLAVVFLLGVPLAMVLPPLAARLPQQSTLAAGLTATAMLGFAGLLVFPGVSPWVWVVLIGIGMAVFPVGLTLLSLRTARPADTAALSAMAQGIGYLLAAAGTFGFGVLHTATGSWTVPILVLLGVLLVQLRLAWLAGRPRLI